MSGEPPPTRARGRSERDVAPLAGRLTAAGDGRQTLAAPDQRRGSLAGKGGPGDGETGEARVAVPVLGPSELPPRQLRAEQTVPVARLSVGSCMHCRTSEI